MELRYVAEQARIGKLSLGVEYRDLYRLDQGNRDDGVAAPNLDSRESGAVLGAHVQDELRLGAAAIVNLGARYDRVSPRDEERLSPRVGPILRPGPATTVKLLYGEAFRSPNAYELYYSDGYSMKGNPGLDAETIRSAEVVLEQGLGERLRASVTLYRWTIDGLIDQTLDPADGLLIFRNLAHAEARGAEAEVRFRIPRRLEPRLGSSYGDAEDADTGERLSNSPRQLGFVKANPNRDCISVVVAYRKVGEIKGAQFLPTKFCPNVVKAEFVLFSVHPQTWMMNYGLATGFCVFVDDNSRMKRV